MGCEALFCRAHLCAGVVIWLSKECSSATERRTLCNGIGLGDGCSLLTLYYTVYRMLFPIMSVCRAMIAVERVELERKQCDEPFGLFSFPIC